MPKWIQHGRDLWVTGTAEDGAGCVRSSDGFWHVNVTEDGELVQASSLFDNANDAIEWYNRSHGTGQESS